MGLFKNLPDAHGVDQSRPLAARMRPRSLDEFIGQEHLLGPGKPLRLQIERDDPGSIILWGPPGSGKTTLAKIIAGVTKAQFVEFSAVLSGIKEIKQVMSDAERARHYGTRTLIFIDEIHRFNKAQQDAFLSYVESGSVRLIGATTENPSFEIISALLSRCRVYTLRALTEPEIVVLLRRALEDCERGLGELHVEASDAVLQTIAAYSNGDARSACNVLEVAAAAVSESREKSGGAITPGLLQDVLQKKILRYDKQGEEHFNLISALHKSVRNSDADASLYWLVRMLESGEDPLYIARRVIRMAVEDIGLASPQALGITLAAKDAIHFLGVPEGNLALAQAVVYLALAPKSNALYLAYGKAQADVEKTYADPVPLHLRNAPTGLMKSLGYGAGYQYAHDLESKVADMECLPSNLAGRHYYSPVNEGFESDLRRRMADLEKRKAQAKVAEETENKSGDR